MDNCSSLECTFYNIFFYAICVSSPLLVALHRIKHGICVTTDLEELNLYGDDCDPYIASIFLCMPQPSRNERKSRICLQMRISERCWYGWIPSVVATYWKPSRLPWSQRLKLVTDRQVDHTHELLLNQLHRLRKQCGEHWMCSTAPLSKLSYIIMAIFARCVLMN